MVKHSKKKILFAILMMLCFLFPAGCRETGAGELAVYGGDRIKYSLCMDKNDSQLVSCPIIVNKKVKKISLNNYVATDMDAISVTVSSIDMNDCVAYKNYYVYFAVLDLACTKQDEAVDADIEKLVFDIDGEIVTYETPYFTVRNTYYYTEEKGWLTEENSLLISGDFTGIYGYFPDEEKTTNLIVTGTKDMTIKSYELADYLKVEELEADGVAVDSGNLEIALAKDEEVSFDYAIGRTENVNEDDILRVSQLLVYEREEKEYLWVYTSGIYIFGKITTITAI